MPTALDRAKAEIVQALEDNLPSHVALTKALASASAAVSDASSTHLSTSAYASLARLLAERVSGRLPQSTDAEAAFDTIFLHGPPADAFRALTRVVSAGKEEPAAADVCARTLMLFVQEKLNGVDRLAGVISTPATLDPGRDEGDDDDEDLAVAAALVHLPVRVANAVLGSAAKSVSTLTDNVINQNEYYAVLSDALFKVADFVRADGSNKHQINTRRSVLVGKLVVLGYSKTLVDRWFTVVASSDLPSTQSIHALADMVLAAPESAIMPLVGALASTTAGPVPEVLATRHASSLAQRTLARVLSQSKTALDGACLRLPLTRPLLPSPTISLQRLISAIIHARAGKQGLRAAGHMWAQASFAATADVGLQHQVTRVVLLYLRALFGDRRHKEEAGEGDLMPWMLLLVTGVSVRLGSSQARVRRYGKLVAEALSRLDDSSKTIALGREPLPKAEKEDTGNDSDLSELAMMAKAESAGDDQDDDEDEMVTHLSRSLGATDRSNKSQNAAVIARCNKLTVNRTDKQEWWCDEDDWSSFEEYEMTSEEEDCGAAETTSDDGDARDTEERTVSRAKLLVRAGDYDAVKKHVAAPMSVGRVLSLLRRLNNGDEQLATEPDVVASTLRMLHARASSPSAASGALEAGAADLAHAVLCVEVRRFPTTYHADIGSARDGVLVALAVLNAAEVCGKLVGDVFCGGTADVARREEALRIVGDAARAIAAAGKTAGEKRNEKEHANASENGAGTVVRRSSRSIAERARRLRADGKSASSPAALAAVDFAQTTAPALFYVLANGVSSNLPSASFIDLSTRDAPLLSHALAALALLLSLTSASCPSRCAMANDLLALCDASRGSTCVAVRRAVALGAGAAARAVGKLEVGAVLEEGKELLAWCMRAAEGADEDVYVRRFAANATAAWAHALRG
jgi:hypothetical protein